MEISYITPTNVRIKGKQVTLVTNLPAGKSKTPADGSLLLGTEQSKEFFTEESGIIFQGPGEYEVKGTKITGFKIDEEVMYTVTMEGMAVFVGNVTSAVMFKEKLHEHDVAVLFANDVLSQTVMGVINARVLIFVGEKAEENAKAFDKPHAIVGKYVVTKDKLPQETEFIFLG